MMVGPSSCSYTPAVPRVILPLFYQLPRLHSGTKSTLVSVAWLQREVIKLTNMRCGWWWRGLEGGGSFPSIYRTAGGDRFLNSSRSTSTFVFKRHQPKRVVDIRFPNLTLHSHSYKIYIARQWHLISVRELLETCLCPNGN